jgi:hypothetical protein
VSDIIELTPHRLMMGSSARSGGLVIVSLVVTRRWLNKVRRAFLTRQAARTDWRHADRRHRQRAFRDSVVLIGGQRIEKIGTDRFTTGAGRLRGGVHEGLTVLPGLGICTSI